MSISLQESLGTMISLHNNILLTSLTPGNILVHFSIILVINVAKVMCQAHKNIGNGNCNESKTNLLNKIIEHEIVIQKAI